MPAILTEGAPSRAPSALACAPGGAVPPHQTVSPARDAIAIYGVRAACQSRTWTIWATPEPCPVVCRLFLAGSPPSSRLCWRCNWSCRSRPATRGRPSARRCTPSAWPIRSSATTATLPNPARPRPPASAPLHPASCRTLAIAVSPAVASRPCPLLFPRSTTPCCDRCARPNSSPGARKRRPACAPG